MYFNDSSNKIFEEIELILYFKSESYKKIKENKIFIVIDVENTDKFDYQILSSFYIIYVEIDAKYLVDVGQ